MTSPWTAPRQNEQSAPEHSGTPSRPLPLQGDVWRRIQEAEGHQVLRGWGSGWSAQAIVEQRGLGRYLYVPYGPVACDDITFNQAIDWLVSRACDTGSWFLRVEPPSPSGWLEASTPEALSARRAVLQRRGFRRAAQEVQPLRTRALDLSRSEDSLLQDMTGTNRTLHRSTAKRGVTIEASRAPEDVRHLQRLVAATAERRGFRAHDDAHLETMARTALPDDTGTLFLARKEDEVISAVLTIDDGSARLFVHGASDPRHRKARAQQSLMVAAILDAREQGLEVADLFGIAPTDDPDHPWAGFTRYKASFGGHVLEHTGAWDLPLRPLPYRALRVRQAVRGAHPLTRFLARFDAMRGGLRVG